MTEQEFQQIKAKQREREVRDRIMADCQPATAGDIRALNERLDRIEAMLRPKQADFPPTELSPYLRDHRG